MANEIRNVHGIEEAIPVFGTYDCVAKTSKMSSDDAMRLVSKTIHHLDDVLSVLALYPTPPSKFKVSNVS